MLTFKQVLTAPVRAAGAALRSMRFGGARWTWASLGGTQRDWSRVAKPETNAIVQACLGWVQTAFPEAPVQVLTRGQDGFEPTLDHPLLALLETPNPAYTGEHLWAAVVADRILDGNAYLLKVRSGAGLPVQLWWVPHTLLEPRWPEDRDDVFISHYEYRVGRGEPVKLDPRDVVHFRYGFDPDNLRKGRSPLKALAREIATDDEAANWTASLLANMGVPGLVISPDASVELQQGDAEEIKTSYQQRFSGDLRGAPLVLSAAAKVSVLSFSPEQMDLKALRRIPEERISAAIGVPAIVAGLGAGLDRSTYSNMAEAREAAYESLLIPMQRLLAAELRTQLVPDFGDPATLRVGFDLSKVRVLQTDQDALHTRVRGDLLAGLITRNQALQAIGMEAEPGGDVLYVPTSVLPSPPALLVPSVTPAVALPAAVPSRNGHQAGVA